MNCRPRLREANADHEREAINTILQNRLAYLSGIAIHFFLLFVISTAHAHDVGSTSRRELRYHRPAVRDNEQHVGMTRVDSFHASEQGPFTDSHTSLAKRLDYSPHLVRQSLLAPDSPYRQQHPDSEASTGFLQSRNTDEWFPGWRFLPARFRNWWSNDTKKKSMKHPTPPADKERSRFMKTLLFLPHQLKRLYEYLNGSSKKAMDDARRKDKAENDVKLFGKMATSYEINALFYVFTACASCQIHG
eukprot:GHVQ01037580.1.p1 GENE.GHVQ01037580.1~~GHVQ01037580.1.p1  ORF type:complete len:247 (+),score=20.50 GHVQ01037580.1:195-935(+)